MYSTTAVSPVVILAYIERRTVTISEQCLVVLIVGYSVGDLGCGIQGLREVFVLSTTPVSSFIIC